MATGVRDEKNGSATPPDENGASTDLEKASSSEDGKQDAPAAAEEEERDPNIVDFDGPDDMENPMYGSSTPTSSLPSQHQR